MHDFTGRPSATTQHWAHWPLAQKMPCGAPSFVVVAEGADAVGEQGRGDRLALARLQRLPLPRERHARPDAGAGQDRVFENAMIGHGDDSSHDTSWEGERLRRAGGAEGSKSGSSSNCHRTL